MAAEEVREEEVLEPELGARVDVWSAQGAGPGAQEGRGKMILSRRYLTKLVRAGKGVVRGTVTDDGVRYTVVDRLDVQRTDHYRGEARARDAARRKGEERDGEE